MATSNVLEIPEVARGRLGTFQIPLGPVLEVYIPVWGNGQKYPINPGRLPFPLAHEEYSDSYLINFDHRGFPRLSFQYEERLFDPLLI